MSLANNWRSIENSLVNTATSRNRQHVSWMGIVHQIYLTSCIIKCYNMPDFSIISISECISLKDISIICLTCSQIVKIKVVRSQYISTELSNSWSVETCQPWVRAPSKVPVLFLSKKLYCNCLVLVGSRNRFKRDLHKQ